jgi:hypothetical protein
MYFCDEACIGQGWIEDVIDVYGKELQESLFAGSFESVCRVISVSPRVRAGGEGTIGEVIENAFVRVFFRTQEDQMFESVRTPAIIEYYKMRRQIINVTVPSLKMTHFLWLQQNIL